MCVYSVYFFLFTVDHPYTRISYIIWYHKVSYIFLSYTYIYRSSFTIKSPNIGYH